MTIEEVVKKLDDHIVLSDEVHDDLAAHDQRVSSKQEFIITELFGVVKTNIDGEHVRMGGRLCEIEKQIQTLYEAQENGGINIHIPWAKLTAVIVACVSAIGAVMVAIIERTP